MNNLQFAKLKGSSIIDTSKQMARINQGGSRISQAHKMDTTENNKSVAVDLIQQLYQMSMNMLGSNQANVSQGGDLATKKLNLMG